MITRQPDRPNYAWLESPIDCMRFVGYCDVLQRSIRHKGWYSIPDDYDEVFRGVVYRLTHSRGFIAGYADPINDGAAFVCLEVYDNERDAAFAADDIARYEAESNQEWCERENARIAEELAAEQFARDSEDERPDMYP